MTNQKIHYSKSKKVNDQMTNDEMPIKAINQCRSSLCRGFDDGKAFNEKKCIPCIRIAAELGFAPAQFKLGECYEFGENGFKKSKKEAAKWYRKAAVQGCSSAKMRLKGTQKQNNYYVDDFRET